jgi:hypothetical protein
VAGGAFGLLSFISAGLLDIFRQVAGGFTSQLLMKGVPQMLERRCRLWKRQCEKQATPG